MPCRRAGRKRLCALQHAVRHRHGCKTVLSEMPGNQLSRSPAPTPTTLCVDRCAEQLRRHLGGCGRHRDRPRTIPLSVRARSPAFPAAWNNRVSSAPAVPDRSAIVSASPTCPSTRCSPSTSESNPAVAHECARKHPEDQGRGNQEDSRPATADAPLENHVHGGDRERHKGERFPYVGYRYMPERRAGQEQVGRVEQYETPGRAWRAPNRPLGLTDEHRRMPEDHQQVAQG